MGRSLLVVLSLVVGCGSSPAPKAAPASAEPVDVSIPPSAAAALDASTPQASSVIDVSDGSPPKPVDSAPVTAASSSNPPPPPPRPWERKPSAAETKACAARGGKLQPVCMSGGLECVIRYRDGGKRCTDKRDCTGECLFEGAAPSKNTAVGACQRTSDPCGCKTPIVGGKVQGGICVD